MPNEEGGETGAATTPATSALAAAEDKAGTPERQRMSPRKLSLLHDDVPVSQVFKVLFGREPAIDERTGELVYYPDGGVRPAFPANNPPSR